MQSKILLLAFLVSGLSFVRCTQNLNKRVERNGYVIADDTLTEVLLDIALMEGYLRETPMAAQEKNRRSTYLYLGILDKYKLSSQRLDSSFAYYRDHLDEWEAILDEVLKRLAQEKEKYKLPSGSTAAHE